MEKQKCFIDMDGVITDSIGAVVSLYNEDFQYYKKFRKIHPSEINTWDFAECNCATREYINTYFNQPRFFERLQFMNMSTKCVIENLKEKYDVTIVTMGYSPNFIGKQLWVTKHLPRTKMICVNMKEHKDKSHIDMSGAILIDDKTDNLRTSNAAEKLLFGYEYSWNSDWNGKRLYDWVEVENYLLRGGKEFDFD